MHEGKLEVENLVHHIPYPMFVSKSERVLAVNTRLLETIGYFDHNVTRFWEDSTFTSGVGRGQTKEDQKKSVSIFIGQTVSTMLEADAYFKVCEKIDSIRARYQENSPNVFYSDGEKRRDIVSKLHTSKSIVKRERCEFKFHGESGESLQVQLVSQKVKIDGESYLFEIVVDSRLLDEFKTKISAYRGILDSEFENLMVHELDTSTFEITWQNMKSKAVLGNQFKEHVETLTEASQEATEESVRRKSLNKKPLGRYRDTAKRWYLTDNDELIPVLIEEYGFEPHLKISGQNDTKSAPTKAIRKFTGIVTSNFDARIPDDLISLVKELNYKDVLLSRVQDLNSVLKIQGQQLTDLNLDSIASEPLRRNCAKIRKERGQIFPDKFYYVWVNDSYEKSLKELNEDIDLDPIGLTDEDVFENAAQIVHGWQEDDKKLINSEIEVLNGIEAHPEPNAEKKLVYFLKRKLRIANGLEIDAIQVTFWDYEKTNAIRKDLKKYLVSSNAYTFVENERGMFLRILGDEYCDGAKEHAPIEHPEIRLKPFGFEVLKELSRLEGKPVKVDNLNGRLGRTVHSKELVLSKILFKDSKVEKDKFYRYFVFNVVKSARKDKGVADGDKFVIFLPKLDEYGNWMNGST